MDEDLSSFSEQYPCREEQINALTLLFSSAAPPSNLIIYGPEATCKTTLTRHILRNLQTPHAIVQSEECVTGRHLLERTVLACINALETLSGEEIDRARYSRCENLSALSVHLQRLLKGEDKFVLVFDSVDKQREAPPTLLPALARLHEMIPNLTTVFILTHPPSRVLHTAGTPHIHFPPYTRDESLKIVTQNPLPIFITPITDTGYTSELHEEDSAWLWQRYCGALWDSLAKSAARDVVSFRALAERLWRRFVSGIVDGTFGTRDFSRLMVAKRGLFQDERGVVAMLVDDGWNEHEVKRPKPSHDLPYLSKFLLCAAYLGSYNPARTDPVHFMKSSEKKRRKRGAGGTPGRPSKHRKIPRRHLPPSPCPLERLLAIFHAILPRPLTSNADLYTQLATLATLRLVLRVGAGDGLDINGDGRWKVNVSWEYASKVGRSIGLDLEEWCTE